MKSFLLFFVIFYWSTICTGKCTLPAPGYSSFFDQIQCLPGYKELQGIIQGKSKIIGEPYFKNVTSDPHYLFWFGRLSGHLVIERINSEEIEFITNQHLVLRDIVWVFILIICVFLLAIFCSQKIQNLCNIRFGLLMGVIVGLSYGYYVMPLMGFAPTPFRILDPQFKNCQILELPPFGLELSFAGIYSQEHFTLINDWVRIKCPRNLMTFKNVSNLEDYIKIYDNKMPTNLGFIHIASNDWWERREKEVELIKDADEMKLNAHRKFYSDKSKECIGNPCLWGEMSLLKPNIFMWLIPICFLDNMDCRVEIFIRRIEHFMEKFNIFIKV